jgi:hypothetical protein
MTRILLSSQMRRKDQGRAERAEPGLAADGRKRYAPSPLTTGRRTNRPPPGRRHRGDRDAPGAAYRS